MALSLPPSECSRHGRSYLCDFRHFEHHGRDSFALLHVSRPPLYRNYPPVRDLLQPLYLLLRVRIQVLWRGLVQLLRRVHYDTIERRFVCNLTRLLHDGIAFSIDQGFPRFWKSTSWARLDCLQVQASRTSRLCSVKLQKYPI